jgi:hypothetical protein
MKTSKQYDIDTIATDGIQVDNWQVQLGPSAEEAKPAIIRRGSRHAPTPPPTNAPAGGSRASVTLTTWDFAGQVCPVFL